jgi:hypothetical protein
MWLKGHGFFIFYPVRRQPPLAAANPPPYLKHENLFA